jgi:hypothetical protein
VLKTPTAGKMLSVPRMKLKVIFIRLALVWFFCAQMVFVCLPAHTTRALSKLESIYAFKPTVENKTALDNEFERTADYEIQRATWKFATLLASDVVLIALCWNWGLFPREGREAVESKSQPQSVRGGITA